MSTLSPAEITSCMRMILPASFSVSRLVILCQATNSDESSKSAHVVGKEHRVVKQFLMAFVAVRLGFSLISPRARSKYAFSLGSPPILGASEEPLRNIMMLRRV